MSVNLKGSPEGSPPLLQCFRSRGYPRFFAGLIASVFGKYVQITALSWTTFEITSSAVWVGIILFCSQGATILFAPWAGSVIDRHDRRRILVLTQWMAFVQASALYAIVSYSAPGALCLAALATLGGAANALEGPARQTFTLELVSEKALFPHAVALNSVAFNGMRFIAPAVGGAIVGVLGAAVCFALSSATALAFGAVLYSLRSSRKCNRVQYANTTFMHALRYLNQQPQIRTTLIQLALVSVTCGGSLALLPALAKPDFSYAGIVDLGLMLSAVGLGNLCGTICFLALRRPNLKFIRSAAWAACALGAVIMIFATGWPIYLALTITGYGLVLGNITSNSITQLLVDDNYRGRTLAIYSSALFGSEAIGGIVAGAVYDFVPRAPFSIAFVTAATVLTLGLRTNSTRVRGAGKELG